jgi:AcrR family transcriptional regulator
MTVAERPNPRSERTRAALITAGRRLYSQRPMDAVTVDDIVTAADVGKGSFYNHFSDREALLKAIAAGIRAAIEDAVERANAGVIDPARRVARAVCVYLRYGVDEPEPSRVLVRIHNGHPKISAPLNRGLVEDIAKGLEEGRFAVATLETGVLYVLGVTQIALARIIQATGEGQAVSLSQQMGSLMLRGLGLAPQEADLIAAQASDQIVRQGAFATVLTSADDPAD